MPEHTPLPWIREGRTIYALNEQGTNRFYCHVQPGGGPGMDSMEVQEANAALIVRAVNGHEELVEALEEILTYASLDNIRQKAEKALARARSES